MIYRIAWKNLLNKPLSTLLSWLLIAVSVGIISLLLLLREQMQTQFNNNIRDVDMVIGAKGSPLQLILSAVYHIDAPTGNIKLKEAEKWMQHPYIETAIPLAFGDSYKGYSIVGTTPAYLEKYKASISEGRIYKGDFETVIGSELAKKMQLKVGSRFFSSHGDENGEEHKHNPYTITGILKPTGSVLDNLLVCTIESVWKIHEHEAEEHEGHENEGEKHSGQEDSLDGQEHEKELTAILVKFRDPMGYMQMPRIINEQTNMMAALPSIEVNRLFSLLGAGIDTIMNIGWGIMILSALSVFITLFNSLKERQYELALMRTMGASRNGLLLLLLLEGMILCVAGFVSGIILSRIGLWVMAGGFEKNYHFNIKNLSLQWPGEAWLLGLTLLLGFAAAFVPALKAWVLNLSKTLSDG